MDDRLDTEERRELPDDLYGLPARREYPMPDAAHVRAAEAYFRYCPEDLKPELARNILKFAAAYGVDVESRPFFLTQNDLPLHAPCFAQGAFIVSARLRSTAMFGAVGGVL